MNSAIQCLCSVIELREYLNQNIYQKEINKDNILGSHGALSRNFSELVDLLSKGEDKFYNPIALKSCIDNLVPFFSDGHQHDSSEFLTYLIDIIHEDVNRITPIYK